MHEWKIGSTTTNVRRCCSSWPPSTRCSKRGEAPPSSRRAVAPPCSLAPYQAPSSRSRSLGRSRGWARRSSRSPWCCCPRCFSWGLVTFERALELGIEDYIYAAGMSRIRHFYVEMVPQAEKYFVGSIHDDLATTMAPTVFGMPLGLAWWQSFLTVPGAIAVVNGVIVGSFAGLLVRVVGVETLTLSVGVGIAVFVVSALLHGRHQEARWQQIEGRVPPLFPSEEAP